MTDRGHLVTAHVEHDIVIHMVQERARSRCDAMLLLICHCISRYKFLVM